MKLRIPVLVFLVSAIFLTGCVALPPVSPHKSEYGIPIRGAVDESQVAKVDELLKVLPPQVIHSVVSLSCWDNSFHYSNTEVGHCHWSRNICIRTWCFSDPSTFWHEIGHAYNFYLNDRGNNFRSRWKEVAGDVYKKEYQEQNTYPCQGVLTRYGATNFLEDIAEWVAQIYLFLTGRFSMFNYLKKGELNQDPYAKKLKLLRDSGFLTEENYQKIIQN